jgi:hypothetical protein
LKNIDEKGSIILGFEMPCVEEEGGAVLFIKPKIYKANKISYHGCERSS